MSSITLKGSEARREAMKRGNCSVDAALKVIGRRATLLLLREAFGGAHRFEEFVRYAGFTEAVTATRLRELVDAGVLERRPYQEPGQRRRDAYHLTEMGRDLYPAIVALRQWGDKWAQGGDGPPLAFTHSGCGAPIEAQVRCGEGHRIDDADVDPEIEIEPAS